jgi:hypothetical protein
MCRRDEDRLARGLPTAGLSLTLITLFVFVLRVATQEPPAGSDRVDLVGSAAANAQPLTFSHRIHAGDNAISCLVCHPYARRSPVAGIPSVQRCAQCHLTIAATKPEVVKLLGYWERKQPIPWVRVHDLPDYVRFTHKRHVLAAIACQTCHGEVAGMEAASRTAPLTMGWCLDCHRARQASTECLTCHY